ncbi:hypothetical protein PInf_002857 [Phytophthora infestans]|nr:hypothetical protein PInf_002857 [Phytophthora infestans]
MNTTVQEPWSLQPTWNGFGKAIQSPSNASVTESDASSESDCDLLSLFEQPLSPKCVSRERSDRGGRPFPYTRSKTRWRKRPHDEIKYLRGQLGELQKLKSELSNRDTKPFHANDPTKDSNRPESFQYVREEKSDKELGAALAENRKLRSMVAARRQVTKALQVAIDEQVRLKAQRVYHANDSVAPAELLPA